MYSAGAQSDVGHRIVGPENFRLVVQDVLAEWESTVRFVQCVHLYTLKIMRGRRLGKGVWKGMESVAAGKGLRTEWNGLQ